MTNKNAAAQPMAVPATHVPVNLVLVMDATVTPATTNLALASLVNANNER